MNVNTKQILALLAVFAVISQGVVAAATLGMNAQASEYPETKFVEDELTVESHDRGAMGWLEYEDDNGKIQQLDGHVNGTQSGAKVSYRADQIDAEAFAEYPRKSGESNNSASWIDTTEWSVAGQNSTKLSVTDTDGQTADGVESVTVGTDGSMTSGDTAYASYSNQSITDDVQKLHKQLVLNSELTDSSAVVEVQVRDGGGDYVASVIDSSRNASDADVIANGTANGVIFQRQLGEYAVQGTGDGTLDAVDEIRVVITDGDASVTVTGLNAQKKSKWDFGVERVPDTSTDDTDDYKAETVYQRPAGGAIQSADLIDLGDTFSDATLHKLTYLDVEYRLQDDPAAVSVEFEDAGDTYPSFHSIFNVDFRTAIPAAYDLTHGNITLETEQSFLSERYITIRYAEAVGDTETDNISDSEWIDLSGSLGDKDTTIVADNTVSSDTEYVLQLEVKLTQTQTDNLQPVQQTGGGGFWGGDGGSPFSSLYNWVVGGFVGLLTMLGLAKRGG